MGGLARASGFAGAGLAESAGEGHRAVRRRRRGRPARPDRRGPSVPAFKQQFYIENRVGAGGAVAAKDVARNTDADGYTLLVGGSGPHIMGPAENHNIGYDPVGDFTHIAMIGGESFALSAQASLGVKSFKELIALSNSKPDPINCGTPGAGSLGQLMVEQMQSAQDRQPQSCAVPRRRAAAHRFFRQPHSGRGDADPADHPAGRGRLDRAAGGHLDRAHRRAQGRADLRRDRLSGDERRDLVLARGPKGLPAAIVQKLNAELRRFIAAPETKQMFEKSALLSMDADSPALTKYIAGEVKRWTDFVEEKGLKK